MIGSIRRRKRTTATDAPAPGFSVVARQSAKASNLRFASGPRSRVSGARIATLKPLGQSATVRQNKPRFVERRRSLASERRPGGKGRTVLPELLQTLGQRKQGLDHALVFFAGFLDLALSHEVLELLISAQPQNFLTAAGGIPSPESRVNDAEKGFEFIGFRVRKGHHQLLSDIVRDAAGEGAEI